MELDIILLNKINLCPKEKYHIFSPICGIYGVKVKQRIIVMWKEKGNKTV
jgi:hypothetical protein